MADIFSGVIVLPSQFKQRANLKSQVDTCFNSHGFQYLLFPEPLPTLYLTIKLKSSPKLVDTWNGKLNITLPNGSTYDLELFIQIKDWNFLSLPEAYIKGPFSDELQDLIGLAHFLPMPFFNPLESEDNTTEDYLKICYSLHNEISIPRHHPQALIDWVISQCKKLFDETLVNISIRDKDIERDLSVMWEQLSSILNLSKRIDYEYTRQSEFKELCTKINSNFAKKENGERPDDFTNEENSLLQHFHDYILSDFEYVHMIEPKTINYSVFSTKVPWKMNEEDNYQKINTNFIVINSPDEKVALPSLSVFSKRIFDYQQRIHRGSKQDDSCSENTPILRLIDLIFWLKTWQKSSLRLWKGLFTQIYSQPHFNSERAIYCCLLIDNLPISFCLSLPKSLSKFAVLKSIKTEIDSLRICSNINNIKPSNLLAQIGLVPTNTINITADFIFNRNIKEMRQENLSSQTIVVIGTGAIGGYLVHNLARLGAGSETGELVLIDPDNLSAENIGRHFLGKGYIGQTKVEALKKQLLSDLPHINIRVFNRSIEDFINKKVDRFDLKDCDILIDATAKPAVADLLNEWRNNLDFPQPCFIHVWIRDNGECVQGLLNEPTRKDSTTNFACRSCLQNAGSAFLEQYDALKNNTPTYAYAACSDFTPYSVSASMSAAVLGTDIVLDYVNDILSPRYRTRYSERWNGHRIDSFDAIKAVDCPYCR